MAKSDKKFLLYRTNVSDKTPKIDEIEYGELVMNYNNNSPFVAMKNSNNELSIIGAIDNKTGESDYKTMSQKSITSNINTINSTLNNHILSQSLHLSQSDREKLDNIGTGGGSSSSGVGKTYPNSTNGEIFNDYTSNKSEGSYTHSEGNKSSSKGLASHSEGLNCSSVGTGSHAEGCNTFAGNLNESSFYEKRPFGAHSEGVNCNAYNLGSHAEGYSCIAGNPDLSINYCKASHSEGYGCISEGEYSHAEGYNTKTIGFGSHSSGTGTIAYKDYNFVIGSYNSNIGDNYLTIGCGNIGGRMNCLRVPKNKENGARVILDGSISTNGADYAEMFEWEDGNPNNEDRVGYLVSSNGKFINKANGNNIFGIVSSNPTVIGNNPDEWHNKYLRDEWGRNITEEITYYRDDIDDNNNKISVPYKVISNKINPEFNEKRIYVQRILRREWSPIGFLGQMLIRQDGTLKENGYVSAKDGIGTNSETKTNIIVLDIITEKQALVFIK